MADSLVPQLDVCIGFETFGVYGRFYLVRVEDEQATVSPSLSYESAVFVDEATFIVEADLHVLLHDLADRDQILRYGGYMQDIFMQVWLPSFPNGTSPMC